MNIFYLSSTPIESAQYHCDKHVVKMILETAQILSTAHHALDGDKAPAEIYRATHVNHPSVKWARESNNNYIWLWCLLSALCREYTHRYGKVHKVERDHMISILYAVPQNIPIGYLTPPPLCMPDEYKCYPHWQAYRRYYRGAKKDIAKWTNREIPYWWNEEEPELGSV